MADTQLRVLIVDDEEGMRLLVKRCLAEDCHIVEAGSGAEALARVTDGRSIDLLVTDEMMPEMEGHELARRFRTQNPDLKVLYLTGFADRLFDAKDQMWEAEAYLDKPFTRDGLRQAIAQVVFGRQAL
ncbi:MAG TPA: response regulator [Vicinamibacterales bacterium]|nr:response regulator [Vicinamibacterales bacterium]